MQTTTSTLSPDLVISQFFAAVYKWMTIALGLTAMISWKLSSSIAFFEYLAKNPGMLWVVIIAQFAAVIVLAGWAHKMKYSTAIILFLVYAALTGVTFSTIFMLYTAASIAKTFVATAGMYGVMALYGYSTSRDLSAWRGFLFMSLIGIIIASVINFWAHSHMLDWMVSVAGIVIFAGLTAYDHQKLKAYALMGGSNNMAIRGALTLYLDFINLFLFLLRFMGNRR